MKVVRLENNKVVEIIPDYALPVEKWYGEEFASQCVEAPDEVQQEWTYDTENKIFKNPLNKTLVEIRKIKLGSLSGMCSGAIYAGVDIGALHYNFTDATQANLEKIARNISQGKTTFLYRADNETTQRSYTTAELNTIIQTQDEWIAVNTNYYEYLKKWVNRETAVAVLNDIHYGAMLPTDLMQELAAKLASIGIDITKYATVLGG